jgi:hypothetical protein
MHSTKERLAAMPAALFYRRFGVGRSNLTELQYSLQVWIVVQLRRWVIAPVARLR